MADLISALEALDRAVAHGSAVLDEEAVRSAAEVVARVRERRGFLGKTTVIALAGGTGSGKSSLLNALAGERVAETGLRRPMTDRALAWIPAEPEPGLVRLLDGLGVEERVGQGRFPHLAVLDLPDFDSVVPEHRAMVDELLPRVDAVTWVLDPEKYNDRVFHEEYLAPRSGYRDQFLFVLNQIDRLDSEEREAVITDLRRSLERDGMGEAVVFALAADPPGGQPEGVELLREHLEGHMEAKRVATAKLVEDLRRAGAELWEAAGFDAREAPSFPERWEWRIGPVAEGLARMVAGEELRDVQERVGERWAVATAGGPFGRLWARLSRSAVGRALGGSTVESAPGRLVRDWAGRTGLEAAVGELTELVTELSFEVGGTFGSRIREELGPRRIEAETGAAVEAAVVAAGSPPDPTPGTWWAAAGILQWALLALLVVGGVWAWATADRLDPGRFPWPLVVTGASVLGMVIVSRLVRWSGRRRGRQATEAYRKRVEGLVNEELSDRIGTPLRHLLRERGVLAASLAEVGVELARVAPEHADRG